MSRFGEFVSYFMVMFARNLLWLWSRSPYVDVGVRFRPIERHVRLKSVVVSMFHRLFSSQCGQSLDAAVV